MKLIFKIAMCCLIIIQSLSFANATETFSSLEMVDGELTGYTIVLTVEYLQGDVARVTRTIRSSNSNDLRMLYNATSYSSVLLNGEVTIQGGSNILFIPFEGDLFAGGGEGSYMVTCPCSTGGPVCGITVVDNDCKCQDKPESCTGCCELTLTVPSPSGPNNSYSFGPALFIEASDIILVDNID